MVKLQGPTALSSGTTDRLEAILAGPKRVALLAYLAAARPFGFQSLLGLLWTDADQVRARATLRRTLRARRGMLGPGVLVEQGKGGRDARFP